MRQDGGRKGEGGTKKKLDLWDRESEVIKGESSAGGG